MKVSKSATNPQPTHLKVHPALGIVALSTGYDAGYAMWSLARALDSTGRGLIEAEVIQKFAAIRLGFKKRTYMRWRENAINTGLVQTIKLKNPSFEMLRICSLLRAVKRLKVARLVGYPVYVPIEALKHIRSWRAHLWTCYLTSFRCRPIAREKPERLTSIPVNTQRAYERLAGVQTIRNYAISDLYATPDIIEGIRKYSHPGAFLMGIKRHGKTRTVVAWQLPNSYTTPLEIARRGQQRKVNRLVGAHHDSLLRIGGGGYAHGERQQVFYPTARDAARAARHDKTTGRLHVEYYFPRLPRSNNKRRLWSILV